MLTAFFKLDELKTNVRTEIMAGVTTFLTMAYIIFVNPDILSTTGMDKGAVFVATCLAAAIASTIMGLWANYPIALAPGMGLNAYFAFVVVGHLGYSWQIALGAVFISGVICVILSLLPVRRWIVDSIPRSQKMAISAGIGFFLGLIALKSMGIVVANEATLVTVGNLLKPEVILSVGGFFFMIAIHHLRVPGSIMIAILAVAVAGMLLGLAPIPRAVIDTPPSLAPTFLKLDIVDAIEVGIVVIIFTFVIVDLFDTAGTFVGLCQRAGFLDENGRMPRLRQALTADSSASAIGALLGTSSTTSYIESAAGINAGGRSGLTAVTVAALFLLALVFSPIATAIPTFATAPAILFVACIMARGMADIDWDDVTEYAPAVVTALAMPFTFSIATGVGLGFITYAFVKTLTGRFEDASLSVWFLAGLFVLKFALD
ncbi:MAG: NCS2 family permease [Alphaproteobacteria bacterium]